jgi:aspartyl-tRNA(Asn)/glutamyl-tRNA(Gln) amidotransferase subunit A
MLDTPATNFDFAAAADIAAAVASGRASAVGVVEATLARIRERDPVLNSFTAVTEQRALLRAELIDGAREQGESLGPLAGVPFAVKNLFDISGLPTLAGSKINRDQPPATRDAALIERLEEAGAVLVGALNMGEYAYDFTGENIHDGASRNPHDHDRMSGGSSGGSGSAVGGGLVPIALGSDTNGSIRVPSSLCGIFGLKPTYGRLSRARSFPFVASLDHLGPLARSAQDLALAYDAMQGFDAEDAACADRAVEPVVPLLKRGAEGLRVAVAGGYFKCKSGEACYAIDRVAAALGANRDIDIPQAERARSAAYIITAAEGASLHLQRLRTRAKDFDPAVRDRLLAGAMAPASLIVKAQKFRRWYR